MNGQEFIWNICAPQESAINKQGNWNTVVIILAIMYDRMSNPMCKEPVWLVDFHPNHAGAAPASQLKAKMNRLNRWNKD